MVKQKKIINTSISSLYKTADFEPTAAMLQALDAYLNADEPISRRQAVGATDHHPTLLYTWLKKPGFDKWWSQAVDRKIEDLHLSDVKKALLHSATKRHDTTAAKILLERYDKDYKPSSKLDIGHGFKGFTPPSRADAVAYSKQKIKEVQNRTAQRQASLSDNTDPGGASCGVGDDI